MFNLVKIELARQNQSEPEYLPVKANETVVKGEALVLTDGSLTKCGTTAKPAYVAAGTPVDGVVMAYRVTADHIWEVEASAAQASLNIGDKVTISGDGLQVTATTSSGVATLVQPAPAAGDKAWVRFV